MSGSPRDESLLSEILWLSAASLEGQATSEELARLESLVLKDDEACQLYVQAVGDALQLRRLSLRPAINDAVPPNQRGLPLSPARDAGSQPPIKRRPRPLTLWWESVNRPIVFSWIFASSFLFAALTILAMVRTATEPETVRSPPPSAPPAAVPPVGERPAGTANFALMAASNCKFRPASDGRAASSDRVALASGTADLRFRDGARVILQGPGELLAGSGSSAQLRHGRLAVHATGSAKGFTIETPVVRVIDLGTRFSVEVAEGGATEVHVVDGAVRIEPLPTEDPTWEAVVLRAGQSRRVMREQQQLVLLPAARPKADTIPSPLPAAEPDLVLSAESHDATISARYVATSDRGGLRIGGRRQPGGTREAVLPFPLPKLPSAQPVAGATLVFSHIAGRPDDPADPIEFSVDLYALPPRPVAKILPKQDFYAGPTGEDRQAVLLAQDVLTRGAPLGSYRISSPELVDYLNEHAVRAGASGQFLFLRLSPDRLTEKNAAFLIASSEHPDPALRPRLELIFEPIEDEPSPEAAP